ncbi:MAG TPA: DUF433 domain-containing protein [Thermoanaerobaculia bacterium]|nr:DUF433 domain-containing protein [Thermoanaerobaculia bacterium]
MIEQPTLTIAHEAVPLRTDEPGVVRVGNTRIPIDTVVHYFLAGCSPEEIVDRFPSLSLPDVYSTIGYYFRHREEVDRYLQERERAANALRALIEARQGSSEGLRKRLLARRAKVAVTETE